MSNKQKVVSIKSGRKQNAEPQTVTMSANDLTSCHCPACKGNILMTVISIYEIAATDKSPAQLIQAPCYLCVNSRCGRVSQPAELLRVSPQERNEIIEQVKKQAESRAQEAPDAG